MASNSTKPSLIPLAPNPNGSPPSYNDPQSLASTLLAVGVTVMITSTSIIVLRLTANYRYMRKLCLDDYLCTLAQLGAIAQNVIVLSFIHDHITRHTWDVPTSYVTVSVIKKQFAMQFLAGPILWAAKAAILALYARIFESIPWIVRSSWVLAILMLLVYGSFIVSSSVYCLPRNGEPWNGTALTRCQKSLNFAIAIGAFGVASDIILFLLPFPLIYKLRVAKERKIGLMLVFLVGFLTVVTSVLSLAYRVRVFLGHDPIWNGFIVTITTVVEAHGAVIVSCAPGVYSFWLNILTQSKLYSDLRSKYVFWKSRRSSASSDEDSLSKRDEKN